MKTFIQSFIAFFLLITTLTLSPTTFAKDKLGEVDSIADLISNDFKQAKRAFQSGVASWYGPRFYGKKTASGEVFKKNEYTAAHRTLPMGTRLKVTNVSTGKAVVVRVNDRGAFHKYGRVIDLSYIAAKKLGMLESGVCNVKIEKL